MRGISEERLREIKESMPDGTSKLFMHGLITQYKELNQWIPLEEFLKSGFEGLCWIHLSYDVIERAYFLENSFTYGKYSKAEWNADFITHVMPLHKPEPPKC